MLYIAISIENRQFPIYFDWATSFSFRERNNFILAQCKEFLTQFYAVTPEVHVDKLSHQLQQDIQLTNTN